MQNMVLDGKTSAGDLHKMFVVRRLCFLLLTAAAGCAASGAAISEMTDLAGGTRAISGAWSDIFGNGGGITNGRLEATFTGWWTMTGVAFTVGPNATLVTFPNGTTDSKGEWNLGGEPR